MALIKCKECGHEIAKSAKACPKCGATVKRTGCLTVGLAIFIGLVALSAIFAAFQDKPDSTASTSPAPARALPQPTASGNPAHDQLMRLSSDERNALFTKYMTGEKCGSVTKNFLQGVGTDGRTKGEAFWNVGCSNGLAYVIQVKPDANGTTSIMDCAVLKAVGGGECFTSFK